MTHMKYHFIGIGGIGMSGLARLLLQRNIEVSGSDLAASSTLENLKTAGAIVSVGHDATNVSSKCKVVYTTGLSEKNPELLAAKKMGCPLLHRSDLLAELTCGYQTIAVAGMHGKTTTSALMVSVLREAGADPSFAIGGILGELKVNAKQGTGPHFVIEACESDGTFLKYRPAATIITNIDLEHMDYFKTEEAILQAFGDFFERVSDAEHLFWCGDDKRLRKIASKGVSYGFSSDCEWQISNLKSIGWQIVFDLRHKDKCYKNIVLTSLGKHNALNGAAVFGLAFSLGIPEEAIRQAFASFRGIARRCEVKGQYGNILCLDDYAHHPVEIKTTLQGVREAIGQRRLIVVYQPHRYTRARDCLGMYPEIFDAADEVIITNIYAAGENPIAGVDDETVFEDIRCSSRSAVSFIHHSKLIESLTTLLQPNDILLTLGAGNITFLGPELVRHLENAGDALPAARGS